MANIDLRLFATLKEHMPDNASQFPITAGMSIAQLIEGLPFSKDEAKLIFIDGVRADIDTQLQGGERVGIFPPVGGG